VLQNSTGSVHSDSPGSKPSWLPVILLELANLTSGLGNAVVLVAVPWLVLEVTDSPAFTGIVAGTSAFAALIMSPLAGWWVDHVGRRTVSVISDILSAVSVAAIPVISLLGEITPPLILVLAALGAAFDPAGYTARRTLLVEAALASRMGQERLNGIHEGIFAIGFTLGPLIGAVAIGAIGAAQSFWIPFLLFAVAAVAILLMRTTPASLPTPSSGTVGWRGVTRGFVVLWKDGPLRLTFLGALVLAAIYLPSESVILPTYFEARNEPGSLGLVIAALAGGSTVGSFAYGWISARMNTPTMLRLMMVGTALSIIPMALLPPLPVLLTAGFFLGLFWGPLNPLMTTLVQKRVSPEEQGRVFGVQLSVWYAAPPLGMVVVGYSVETLGISTTYLALATLLSATALAILLSRSVRQLDA